MQPLKIIYHPAYQNYDFGKGHPFSSVRPAMLIDLLEALGISMAFHEPKPADDEALLTVHTAEYLEIVASASVLAWTPEARRFGIDTEDVPIFPGMDEAARWLAGGALEGARQLLQEPDVPKLQLGGGLHHARPARASGFCIYNDLSVAIQHLRNQGLRVAYIDVDVHHGDGVQWIHFNDPDVLTISLHESGQYLFPGTGMLPEMRLGASVINVPLEMHTDDVSYLESFEAIVPAALDRFRPDVLVCQCGVDAHAGDPLAHLDLTTHGFARIFTRLRELALSQTGGRALFTLGGGYDLDATARCWTLLTLILLDRPLPERLPESWLARWSEKISQALTPTLHDPPDAVPPQPDQETIRAINRTTVQQVQAAY